MNLKDSVQTLPMVNKKYAEYLARLEITTIDDLLRHLPVRYDDFSQEKKIEDLKEGDVATLRVKVQSIRHYRRFTSKRRLAVTDVTVEDETGTARCVWFNQRFIAPALKKVQDAGAEFFVAGTMQDQFGAYFSAPAIEMLKDNPIHTKRLVPVYVQTRHISSRWLRYAINHALQHIKVRENLPRQIMQEENLMKKSVALHNVHFPPSHTAHEQARERFDFEKILILVLAQLHTKQQYQEHSAPAIPYHDQHIKTFIQSLPFQLTSSQQNAVEEITKDMQKTIPMNRLLEGDVGSGKTIVALTVALNAIREGFRVVFMAPTEILAQQHYNTISKTLQDQNVSVGLLTKAIKDSVDEADLIVGTHALIQKHIMFEKVGLMIIDEQHRFGVSQRAQLLRNAETTPHLLSMTATPIPRTLALTIYGDLDISFLHTPPKGRLPIETHFVETIQSTVAHNTIQKELKKGHQMFVIFPLIETSTKMNLKAAEEEYVSLKNDIFPDYSVGLLHGRMKQKEKDEIMQQVVENKIQILVSTSVVEVGVDIPNATVMVIEGAHRFGLAQLHQFRGRVGRSSAQSYCFLVSEGITTRIKAFLETQDGFDLAKKDMAIRGAGQLYGTQQHGIDNETLHILQNTRLIERIRKQAENIFPNLSRHPSLAKKALAQQQLLHPE